MQPTTPAAQPTPDAPGAAAAPSPPPAATTVWSDHIPALDGVRGAAILLVLYHHFTILSGSSGLDRMMSTLGALGASGVDLFFVLSGFLITGILFDSKGGERYFRNFYARRTLRIFPLYYAVIVLALVVVPRLGPSAAARFSDPVDPWSYWLYVSNLSMGYHGAFRHGILDVTWSLAIEEQFYLIWPAFVWMLGRVGLMRLCVAVIACGLVIRGAMLLAGVNWVAIYILTPCRMDGLAAGAWIALAARGGGGLRALLPGATIIGPLSGALLALVLLQGWHYWQTPLGLWLAPPLLAALYGSLLVGILAGGATGSSLTRAFSQRWLRLFGKYSYALYLFHLPIGATLAQTLYGPARFHTLGSSQLPGQLLYYLAATSISLAAAWLSWNLFEKQFLKLKRFFPTGRRAPASLARHDQPVTIAVDAPPGPQTAQPG